MRSFRNSKKENLLYSQQSWRPRLRLIGTTQHWAG